MHRQGPIAQLPRQVYTQSRQLKDFKLSPCFSISQFSHSTVFPIWQGSDPWRSTWCMTFVDMKLFCDFAMVCLAFVCCVERNGQCLPILWLQKHHKPGFQANHSGIWNHFILWIQKKDNNILWLSTGKNYSSGVCIISKK